MRIIGNNPAAENAEITAVASGTLPSGQPVIVNADGTVSVVAETSGTESLGSHTTFEGGETTNVSATFDSSAGKIVVAYVDEANTTRGTAVVGTVSGTAISFGTPVVFESGVTSFVSATYEANAQKVVIAYQDASNSSHGTAVVGTVSGTSISFGAAVVFESNGVSRGYSTAYDFLAQKIVIAYQHDGNLDYGTAVVGTVSGTSISFGTPVVFESAAISSASATYANSSSKIVIAYTDKGNLDYGTAIVGTVSGTSISFGTAAVFESASTNYASAVYSIASEKVIISYRDNGNSGYGTSIVGTVDGTSISFGTPVVFESASTSFISSGYDVNAQRVVIGYRDIGNTNNGTLVVGAVSGTSISFTSPLVYETGTNGYTSVTYDSAANKTVIAYVEELSLKDGRAVAYQPAYTNTNLTSENFIGFANGAAADTGKAKVDIGCGINDAQSGLTAGQTYYVQTDGTLGLTAADPSVIAGTAISATEIIVKG